MLCRTFQKKVNESNLLAQLFGSHLKMNWILMCFCNQFTTNLLFDQTEKLDPKITNDVGILKGTIRYQSLRILIKLKCLSGRGSLER